MSTVQNNGTSPESALLLPGAPTNVCEMYRVLIEGRLAAEIDAIPLGAINHYRPSVWGHARRNLKRRLLKKWRSQLVPDTLTVVSHDPQGLDFMAYILRHQPNLPLGYFPEHDHALLRHFVINKLLFSGVRVFETAALYPPPYAVGRAEFAARVAREANRPVNGFYESFGFRTRKPFAELADLGALGADYGLNEFADRVPAGAVLDIGPFIGDSTFAFSRRLAGRRILCLEPDPVNRRELEENLELNGIRGVEVISTGAGAEAARLPVVLPGTAGCGTHALKTAEHFIDVDTVDRIMMAAQVSRVGLIKMDIEGSEADAMRGAAQIIVRDQPMLIIAAYHRGADIFEIPRFVRGLNRDYEFRFRHLDPRFPCSEYVIVALPPRSS